MRVAIGGAALPTQTPPSFHRGQTFRETTMRRHILVLLLFALILTGFHPHPDGQATQAQAAHVTLRVFWMKSPSDPEDVIQLVEGFAASFEDENPGIDIDIVFVDWSEGREAIHEAVQDGNPPDLAVVGARWVPEFVAEGYIEPLDRYMTRSFRRRFTSTLIEEGAVYQNRTFGLPVAASTQALYYNPELLAQAGYDAPPQTWDELLEIGIAVGKLDDEVSGFGLQAGDGLETNTYFYYFVWGNGGDLYNTSNTASALNQPAAIEALTFMKRLVDEGATQPDVLTYDRRIKLETEFANGTLAMMISGPWVASRLRTSLPDFEFGVAPIPYNTNAATYGVIDTLVMFSTSRHKAEAWDFLDYLFRDEIRFEYTITQGVLPGLTDVAERPEFAEDQDFAVFLSLLPSARFEPLHTESETIAQTVIEAVIAVHSGNTTPEDALNAAADQIDYLLGSSSAGW